MAHRVEPPEFFRSLNDDELLCARERIEDTLDWANRFGQRTRAMFQAWRINLSQTNAEITRRLSE